MEENRIRDAHIALGHLVEFCQRGVAVDPIGPHKVLAGFIKDVESEGQSAPANPGMAWELVEQTSSRLADSMDAACHETSLALREDRIAALQADVDRLRARLEIPADGGYDGIACRDETIRGQDEVIARLRAEKEEMRALALEGANTIIDIKTQETAAARDVLAERRRQVEGEGRTPAHDDRYARGELASAGAAYAIAAYEMADGESTAKKSVYWPWNARWWKPSSPRRNLVKAGALILAEIERLDRADAKAETRIDVIGQNGNDGEHYAPQLSMGEVLAAAAPDEVAEAMASDEGWTKWKGHARPVAAFALVDLKLRDGSRLLHVKAGDYAWKWIHGHGDLDVIAYRLPRD